MRTAEAQIRQLEDVLRQKKQLMAPLAPVYALPDEVVAMILKFAYEHHFPHCRLDDGQPHTNSPIAISHVSRWWRRQALSLPFIWTCIHVVPQQPPHYATVAKLYLERSRDLPLSIFFQCFSKEFERNDTIQFEWPETCKPVWMRLKTTWKHLLEEKDRWRHLTMYMWHEESAADVLTSLSGRRYPRLEYFGYSLAFEQEFEIVPSIDAPLLATLRAESWFPDFRGPRRPFSRLTELKVDSVHCTVVELLRVIQEAAETLQRLSLCKVVHDAIGPAQITIPPLPKLTHLLLEGIHDSHAHNDQSLYRNICRAAPHLEMLSLAGRGVVSVLCTIGMVFDNLHHLGLPFDFDPHMGDFRGLFSATPHIRSVHLGGYTHVASLLQATIDADEAAGGCVVWPTLHRLTLDHGGEWNMSGMRAFIEHRARVGKPLSGLGLDNMVFKHVSNEDRETLRQLGVNIWNSGRFPPAIGDDWWDWEVDKPNFATWNGVEPFYDQYDRIPMDVSELPKWLEAAHRLSKDEDFHLEPGTELDT